MTQNNVVVIGAGIGGLSAAIAMRQTGRQVTVVELNDDMHNSVYGVGIIQPINALRALDAIGCAQACIDAGFPAEAWGAVYDVDGTFVCDMAGARIEGSDLPPMNGLTRPKLHQILTDRAVEVGVDIRYQTRFSGLEETADSVTVFFESGDSETFDFVVGADGVRSAVRRYVLDEELKPTYIGQSAYRVNMPRVPEVDRIILQHGPAGMAGYVPIGKDLAYAFFNTTMNRDQRPPKEELADRMRELFTGFGGVGGRMREEFIQDDSDIVLRPEESMIAPAPWHRNRVVLMGDAVHAITPHLGQGAAQAIEDGVVLADSLEKFDNLDEAFADYTERRFERCKLIVETSSNIAAWEMGNLPDFDNVAATSHVLDVMAQPL